MTSKSQAFIKNPIYVSYTSLSDFLKCPKSYYYKNIYKQSLPPQAGVEIKDLYRIQIASPYLTLGAVVHDTIKWYLQMRGQIEKNQLEAKFRNLWLKYKGKRGGFCDDLQEAEFGRRGLKMLSNFWDNVLKLEKPIPAFDLIKLNLHDNLILIGRLDFIGELPDDSLHLIDFKTGMQDEKDSLQLHIYAILAQNQLGKKVVKISYWYLDKDISPKEAVLDSLEEKLEWLKEKSQELKKAIEGGNWVCIKEKEGLCRDCKAYQAIIDGKGEYQFSDHAFKKQIYYLDLEN